MESKISSWVVFFLVQRLTECERRKRVKILNMGSVEFVILWVWPSISFEQRLFGKRHVVGAILGV